MHREIIDGHVRAWMGDRYEVPAKKCRCPVGSYDRGNTVHEPYCPLSSVAADTEETS